MDDTKASSNLDTVITYADLDAGEEVWGAKLKPQLEAWVAANPTATGHVNGRDEKVRRTVGAEKELRQRQRFRGGWVAETKQERIKQQGGKYKGKWGRKPKVHTAASSELLDQVKGSRQPDGNEHLR